MFGDGQRRDCFDGVAVCDRAGLEAYVFESAGRIAATDGWEALEAEGAPPSVEATPGVRPVASPE